MEDFQLALERCTSRPRFTDEIFKFLIFDLQPVHLVLKTEYTTALFTFLIDRGGGPEGSLLPQLNDPGTAGLVGNPHISTFEKVLQPKLKTKLIAG
ncbi:hypothetical protein J6590_015152 [Homalodisca vitripennis]|nr:hypothetical protein J6590_015152 [Homalodisca vitripennis]